MENLPGKISIFIPSLYGGGAERAMLKLAGGIASRGFKVDLVLARAKGPYLAEVPTSVNLIDLKARRLMTSLPALIRYIRCEQPVAMLSALQANIIALVAKKLARVPTRLIVSERNMLSQKARHSGWDLRTRFTPFLARCIYPQADGIVAVTKGVADDLTQITGIPRERICVIYNPIVTPEFQEKTQTPLDHPWFKTGEPPVILAVGRLTKQKDYPTLIRAFAQVRKNRVVRLLILGEGEERPILEALVKELGVEEDVNMPGFVVNPYHFMVRAAVFVLSSRWEGLPGVLIEALYCGAPLVATDCPTGPREILSDGKYGLLVPVGDSIALYQAIEKTLAGKKAYVSRESWLPFEQESVVDQYIHVLLTN